jgi:D-alanyl-D-alanine carboxypeptidase
MRKEAGEALQEMISAAASGGNKLWSQSGYRGYSLQSRLYSDYVATKGLEAAEKSSARPGHSEHQTGLTTDLNTINEAFGDTDEGRWVAENCYKYGFIIRYTMDNLDVTLFKYEPWHIRYIGKDAATEMKKQGISSFEEYWVKYEKYKQF